MSVSEGIIIALITGLTAVIGNYFISIGIRKDDDEKSVRREERVDARLEQIEAKLEVHNHYAEKIGSITEDIAVIKNEIKNIEKGNK